MTRIRSFEKGSQNVRVHTSDSDCRYQVVSDAAGEVFLHLSTFGSDDRASDAKSSQSMQFDREQALSLIRVLRETFPGL